MAQSAQMLGAQLLGASPGIAAVRETVEHLLRQSAGHRLPPILIHGETGTGKGLLARVIHGAGPRREGPFVDINCAAIPEPLLEAELFGFERGAFTDARRAKPGLFQAAHRGTIFLDEVGLLPERLQAKLLKVIEERAVRRLGSTQSEPVDVAILTATNEDLVAAVRARRFREDLYHRLAVLTIKLPALRDRREDIVLLGEHFLARTCAEYGLGQKTLSADAMAVLQDYSWPGNVRELANVIERASLLGEGPVLTAVMLGIRAAYAPRAPAASVQGDVPVRSSVASVEERLITQTLQETSWNILRSAARLGISRNTLKARIRKYGLQPVGPSPARSAPPAAVPLLPPPSPSPAPPTRAGVQWESRRLALLRVALAALEDEPPAAEASRALDMLIQKVEAFGGRLVEIGTTSIVAAFGLDPVEDAPRRAALAAMAMQKAAIRSGEPTGGLAVKVAIHAELTSVARVGGVVDIDGDVKRRAWAVLDELLMASEPGAITVSQSAAALLARRFDIIHAETTRSGAGSVHRLTDYRATPFDVGGYIGRFVGREGELELLRTRFEVARAGQGQIVALVGEAGIGKSRLLFEFQQSLAAQPVSYYEGRCLSYGSATPFLPILEVVRTMCGFTESDTLETMADKLRTYLEKVGIDAAASAPWLLHLLGTTDETDRAATQGPEIIKARTFEALHALLLKSSLREPLVVAIEDLHWIDQTSDEYLEALAERVVGCRILVIVTYRPGYRPPWIEKSSTTQIALQPLTPQDSLVVVRVTFGTEEVADSLAQLILAKAEGNPFFLEELARAVRDHRGAALPLTVPDTIQEVLLARIDRLPPEERQLLQSGAVIGKNFPLEILRAITGQPDEPVRRGLQHLRAGDFVYETNLIPQPEYTFKHALTHEVAYESLPVEQRRTLHAKIFDAIETLYPDRLAEHVERLAHHAYRGEVWGKALSYLSQAGAKAASRSAHREAVACFEQALAALTRLAQNRDTLEQAIDLRFGLRTALIPLGEYGRIFDYLQEAEAVAKILDDSRRLGRICVYMTSYFREIGDYDRAIESGQRASAIAEALRDLALQIPTNHFLGQVYYDQGDYRRGSVFLRRNVESLVGELRGERLGLPYLPAVHSRTWLVFCLTELGEFAEANEIGASAARIAESADHPFSLTSAYWGLGRVCLRKGDLERAILLLERGFELSRVWSIRILFPGLATDLGSAYLLSGRVPQALPLLERAVEQHASIRRTAALSTRVAPLSRAYLLAGRLEDAAEHVQRALALARDHNERGNQAYALHLLGEVASHVDAPDIEKAEASYLQALALGQELGMRPLAAQCHMALGKLYRRGGNTAKALEHLSAANALFRALDMPFWLGQGETELRGLR